MSNENKLAALRAVLVAAVDLIDAEANTPVAAGKIPAAPPATFARNVNTPSYKEVPVSSSNIAKVGYYKKSRTLRVTFNNGSQYDYFNVPADVFDDLVNAASVGSYHNRNIKGKYSYALV